MHMHMCMYMHMHMSHAHAHVHVHAHAHAHGRTRTRLVIMAMRPRLQNADAALLHRHLGALGHAANNHAAHITALAAFECAHSVLGDTNSMLAAANMRLHLGLHYLASATYEKVLTDPNLVLTQEQRSLATRKQSEVAAVLASAPAGAHWHRDIIVTEDEVEQLLNGPPLPPVATNELNTVVRLLRRLGHVANDAGEVADAQRWFDSCYHFSRSPVDLLSAANMRIKQDAGACSAECLYLNVLATEDADDEIFFAADRKLEALAAARRASASVPAEALEAQRAIERKWLFETALAPTNESDESVPVAASEACGGDHLS